MSEVVNCAGVMNPLAIAEYSVMFSIVLDAMDCYDSDVVLYFKEYIKRNYMEYCPRINPIIKTDIHIKLNILFNNKFINNNYELTKKGYNYLYRDDIRQEIITNTNYESAYNLSTYNDSLYFKQGDQILIDDIPETFRTFNKILLKPTINYKREMTSGMAKGNCVLNKQHNNHINFMRDKRIMSVNGIQNSDFIRYNYLREKLNNCDKEDKPYYQYMMSLEKDIVCMNWNDICFTYQYYSERRIGPNYSDKYLRGPDETSYNRLKKQEEKIKSNIEKKLKQIQKETDKAIKELMNIRKDILG